MDETTDSKDRDEFEAPLVASAPVRPVLAADAGPVARPAAASPERDMQLGIPRPTGGEPAPSREEAVLALPRAELGQTPVEEARDPGPPSARIPTIAALAPAQPPARDAAPPREAEAATDPAPAVPAAAPAPTPAAPASGDSGGSARIIPFVPRGGPLREAPSAAMPLPARQPFARQPIPYFISPADGGPVAAPTPAVPPPPSGFRRPAEWARQPGAAPTPAGAVPDALASAAAAPAEPAAQAATPAFDWRLRFDARRLVKRIFQALGILVLAYATLVVTLVAAYRWSNPPASALMLGQRLGGTDIHQIWTPIERISPNLQLAVVLSEDARFCAHHGVDWGELREAIEQSLDGAGARGGSTISMQTVKNLFLWPSKSYVRKAVEIPLAMGAEMAWPKARMLEIYLNIAEWGPGVFGAEAAARYHFGKSASALTAREASLLAVSLPNPFDRQAGNPGPGTQRLADVLQSRMRRAPQVAACGKPGRPARLGVADSRWQ
ncbi:MAG: monofunctional biosynthetic peptidoglycan transglycosylase [Hyphomicrobiaceae bacterium]|nr:monofunctional biosynthetic peptidoglycan transglycosylase [Hyphomicrobiaceae bacterium]